VRDTRGKQATLLAVSRHTEAAGTPAGRAGAYTAAAAAVVIATAGAWLMFAFVEPANLIMAYLLAVVVIAARYGRGPSVFATVCSVAAFDFFFVPPYFTFAVADTQYLLTFGVMLVVGLVIGGLTVRVRQQAHAAGEREQRTAALYAMSRELAHTVAVPDLVAAAARHIKAVFGTDIAVLLPGAHGALEVSGPAGFTVAENDRELATWVLDHGERAGLGTPRSGAARAMYLPLLGHRAPLGVVAVQPARGHAPSEDTTRHLDAFVTQTALVLERARLADEAQEARVRAEAERLRSSLLASVSHDLRTPLAAITGAATTMLDASAHLTDRTRHELLESVRHEAERLNRLVQNLLEMTRLESGAVHLRREWHPLEEVVGAALGRLGSALGGRRVATTIPDDLPLVAIDDVLLEQVFVNLLDNAIKYTPPGSPIRIVVTSSHPNVFVEVADGGPGLPPGHEDKVFEKFYRVAIDGPRGAGLGLAVCRGIVQAHGGRMWAENLPGRGVAFFFTLPLADRPPLPVPRDA
jgi:two-component system, OmpR family, sensor histidine kinase KdpD